MYPHTTTGHPRIAYPRTQTFTGVVALEHHSAGGSQSPPRSMLFEQVLYRLVYTFHPEITRPKILTPFFQSWAWKFAYIHYTWFELQVPDIFDDSSLVLCLCPACAMVAGNSALVGIVGGAPDAERLFGRDNYTEYQLYRCGEGIPK